MSIWQCNSVSAYGSSVQAKQVSKWHEGVVSRNDCGSSAPVSIKQAKAITGFCNASTLFKSMKAHCVSCGKKVAVDKDKIYVENHGKSMEVMALDSALVAFEILSSLGLSTQNFLFTAYPRPLWQRVLQRKWRPAIRVFNRCFGYSATLGYSKVQSLLTQAVLMTCASLSENSDVNSKKHLCVLSLWSPGLEMNTGS